MGNEDMLPIPEELRIARWQSDKYPQVRGSCILSEPRGTPDPALEATEYKSSSERKEHIEGRKRGTLAREAADRLPHKAG